MHLPSAAAVSTASPFRAAVIRSFACSGSDRFLSILSMSAYTGASSAQDRQRGAGPHRGHGAASDSAMQEVMDRMVATGQLLTAAGDVAGARIVAADQHAHLMAQIAGLPPLRAQEAAALTGVANTVPWRENLLGR